jgi:hypothetical protein
MSADPRSPTDVSMIEGEVEILEIDALTQERGDRQRPLPRPR